MSQSSIFDMLYMHDTTFALPKVPRLHVVPSALASIMVNEAISFMSENEQKNGKV